MMSRFRGQIVLMLDICLIFVCNFMLFLPALYRFEIRLWNLVLHIGFLTVCVLLFSCCSEPITASGVMRRAGSISCCWRG